MNAKEKMDSLSRILEHHNYLYYVEAKPEISDREYDTLLEELESLEHKYPSLVNPNSPTKRVGGQPLEYFETKSHTIPMLSLSNTYSKQELLDYDLRTRKLLPNNHIEYVIEPKIDGVAISLRYEKGLLINALTRGDGTKGDDVTENIRTIHSIPMRLHSNNPPDVIEIRGEIYFDKKGFQKLNLERQELGIASFANPRNACAGSLKLLDAKEVAKRKLDAVFYNIGEYIGEPIETHEILLKSIQKLGFRIAPQYWKTDNTSDLFSLLDELQLIQDNFPFEIDGAVIKINDRTKYDSLGYTSKSPRWAVAFKYEPEQAETILKDITIQVGRTGVLTPVAELEPVQLAGTTIKRATLHNLDEIRRKDIRIGDHVIIQKAGEIIPVVMNVVKSKRSQNFSLYEFPEICPCCLKKSIEKIEGEVAFRCINLQCPAQIKSWIEHFSARVAMDISGLGESMIQQLIDEHLVQNPADLYNLTEQDLNKLERTGKKSINNLLDSIEKSKSRPFSKVILGLGIRHIGKTSAEKLVDAFPNIDILIQATEEQLEEIDDIGPIVAHSLKTYFENPSNIKIINALRSKGVNFSHKKSENINNILDGETFVITGILETLTRDKAQDLIKDHGGKVSNSISKNTKYLVAGKSAGSKLTKAEKLGIQILSEKELFQLLEK